MFNWLNKMCDMFEWNAYTDDNRVSVEYSERCKIIIIKVLDDVEYIDVNKTDLNDFGLMYAVLDKVKSMYDKS